VSGNLDNPYLTAMGMSAGQNPDGSLQITDILGNTLIAADAPAPSPGSTPGYDFHLYLGSTQVSYSIPLVVPEPGQTLTYGSSTVTQSASGAITATSVAPAGDTIAFTAQPYSDGSIGFSGPSGAVFYIMSASAAQTLSAGWSPTSATTSSTQRARQDWYTAACIALLSLVAAEILLMIYTAWQIIAEIGVLEAEILLARQAIRLCLQEIAACTTAAQLVELRLMLSELRVMLLALNAFLTELESYLAVLVGVINTIIQPLQQNVKDCVTYLLSGQVPMAAAVPNSFTMPDGSVIAGATADANGNLMFILPADTEAGS
jgi:hypothetical protein